MEGPKVHSRLQIFKKVLMAIFFSLKVITINLLKGIRWRNIFCIFRGLNLDFIFNKIRHSLLDEFDFTIHYIMKSSNTFYARLVFHYFSLMKFLEVECLRLRLLKKATSLLFVYYVHIAFCCVHTRCISVSISNSFIPMVFVFVAFAYCFNVKWYYVSICEQYIYIWKARS